MHTFPETQGADTPARPGDAAAQRRQWIDALDELVTNGILDAEDQSTLIRHYDAHRQAIDEEFSRIVPEYQRRVAGDGQALADEWLAQTAREIGQRDGEGTRRLVEQLNVMRNSSPDALYARA